MGLSGSIEIAASGMSAQRRRLEVIASNLANARTTRTADGGPYRKRTIIFRTLEIEHGAGSFASQLNRHLNGVEVSEIIQDSSPPQREFNPTHPDADADGYVHMPNINAVDEMINMIGAARSYEANLEVLKTTKRMAAASLELIRI